MTWCIYRIRGTPAQYLDSIEAPDADSAVEKYATEHGITDAEQRRRLVAAREI